MDVSWDLGAGAGEGGTGSKERSPTVKVINTSILSKKCSLTPAAKCNREIASRISTIHIKLKK